MWRLLPLLLVYLVPSARTASAGIPSASSLSGFRAAITQQNLQTVLMSIEERLRGLDNLYSARYAPRLDLSMEQQARRLDSMESRLGRLETLLELRLDKLSETLSARQLKEELSRDQLGRKVDSNYERLNHRLGYMEARLDMGITKLQTTVDAGSNRIERLEIALGGRHGDVGADILDMKSSLDDLKRSFQSCHNTTMTAVASGESSMKQYYERLASSLVQIHGELNRTLVQNDETAPPKRDSGDHVITSVERHASNFGTKITNMYNELWRRTQLLETLSKDSMSLSNATRRELQDGLRSMSVQINRYCCVQADRGKPSSLDMTLESLGGSVSDVSRKLDTYFQTLITTHDVILENCHRIQKEEPLIEERLTDVLERIIDISSNNRCQSVSAELQEVHELLKSHHTTVVRNVGHSTNTVMRAADNSSKDTKNLVEAITEMRDGLMTSSKDIHSSLKNVHEEQENVNQLLEKIASTLQEFNEQLTEINAASLFGEHSEETTLPANSTSCPDSKKIASDVAQEIQQLPTAPLTEEQVNHIINELKDKGAIILAEKTEKQQKMRSGQSDRNIPNETDTTPTPETTQIKDDISDEYEDDNRDLENEIWKELHGTFNQSQTIQTHNNNTMIDNKIYNLTTEIIQEAVDESENTSSSSNEEKDSKSAEVTIKIIPQHHLDLDNSSSSSLFEIDLNHVAAIIHGNDPQGPQASVTIVHNDKGITPEGQVKYSSTLIEPPAELILNPSGLESNSKNNIKILIVPETEYHDNTSFMQSQNTYNSSEVINDRNSSIELFSNTRNEQLQYNISLDNINATESNPLLPLLAAKNSVNSSINSNDNNTILYLHNSTQNINDTQMELFKNSTDTHKEKEIKEIHIKEVLQHLLDLQGADMNSSKAIQDLWRAIHLNDTDMRHKNGSDSGMNNTNTSAVGESATSSNVKFLEHGTVELGTEVQTEDDVPIRHYVSKLEELASRLARIDNTTQNIIKDQHKEQVNQTSKEET